MHRMLVRRTMCLLLIVTQLGCRSVYRFRCTSNPSEAGVVIAEQMVGETPCNVKIPKDSEWIQDSKIEFVFCLPDGREEPRVVNLHGLEPSNPLAEIVATPFWLVGTGLLFLGTDRDDDEDSHPSHFWYEGERDEDHDSNFVTGFAGIGILGIGAGLHYVLGGDPDSLSPYKVHVDFNEPAGD
ncbi:MAG: hypothetical protein ABFE13_09935 [Phycisphaerales bacterium]